MKSLGFKSSPRKASKQADRTVDTVERKSIFEPRKPIYEVKFRDSYLQTSLLPTIERKNAIRSLKIKEKVQKLSEASEVRLRGRSETKQARPANPSARVSRFPEEKQAAQSAEKLNESEENCRLRLTNGLSSFNQIDMRTTRFRFRDRTKAELRNADLVQGIPKKLTQDERDTYLRTCHSILALTRKRFPELQSVAVPPKRE